MDTDQNPASGANLNDESGRLDTENTKGDATEQPKPEPAEEISEDFEILPSEPEEPLANSSEQLSSTKVIYLLTEDHYARVGFFAAMQPSTPSQNALNVHFTNLSNRRSEEINAIKKAEGVETLRFEKRLEETQSQIDALGKSIQEYRNGQPELSKRLVVLKSEISERKVKLQKLFEQLEEKKENLVSERIKALKKEMEEVLEAYQANFPKEPNKSAQHQSTDEIAKITKKKLDAIQHNLIRLSNSGFSSSGVRFLKSVGYAAIFGASWIFTIFTSYINSGSSQTIFFDGKDYLSQIIQRIFEIGPYQGSWEKGLGILTMTGLLLLVLGVVTLLAFFAHEWLKNLQARLIRSRISSSLRNGIAFQANLQSEGFLSFWLQIMPGIFVFGVLIITLAVIGLQTNSLAAASQYTASLAVGAAIAFSISGILTMYVGNVIEKRSERSNSDSSPATDSPKRRSPQWELMLSVGLFIISLLSLVALRGGQSPNWTTISLLSLFTSLSLIAGIALGYATRFEGLIFLNRVFSDYYQTLQLQLDGISHPSLIDATSRAGRDFKRIYSDLYQQLLQLVQAKTTAAIRVLGVPESNSGKSSQKVQQAQPQTRYYLFSWKQFKALLRRRGARNGNQQQNVAGSPTIPLSVTQPGASPESLEYFGVFRKPILDLQAEIDQLSIQEQTLTKETEQIRRRVSEVEQRLQNKMYRWKQSQNDLRKQYAKYILEQQRELDRIEYRYARYEHELRDGYLLGVWCRENDIGPTNGFYPSMK